MRVGVVAAVVLLSARATVVLAWKSQLGMDIL